MSDGLAGAQWFCNEMNKERDMADINSRLDDLALAWANRALSLRDTLRAAAELGWESK